MSNQFVLLINPPKLLLFVVFRVIENNSIKQYLLKLCGHEASKLISNVQAFGTRSKCTLIAFGHD